MTLVGFRISAKLPGCTRRCSHGKTNLGRCIMGSGRATFAAAEAPPSATPGPEAERKPRGSRGHSVRVEDRYPMGVLTAGDGVRLWHDMLASASRLAEARRMGRHPPDASGQTAGSRTDRLGSCRGRQYVREGGFWGAQTGPNPTDRRKAGSKHHVLTDANGIPLATTLTGANAHDVTQLLPLVDAIPPVPGKRGHPRRRPKRVQGDRAYDSQPHRKELRRRGITPVLARRNTENGSGLGVFRWVVERTNSWLHQFRRLRVRFERRADIHRAFLTLGCIVICSRFL